MSRKVEVDTFPDDDALLWEERIQSILLERIGTKPEEIVSEANREFAKISGELLGEDHLLTKTYREAATEASAAAFVRVCRELIKSYRHTQEQIYRLSFPETSVRKMPEWLDQSADERLLREAITYDMKYDLQAQFVLALTYFHTHKEPTSTEPLVLQSQNRQTGRREQVYVSPFAPGYLDLSLAEAIVSHIPKGRLFPGSPEVVFITSKGDRGEALDLWRRGDGDERLTSILRPDGLLSPGVQPILRKLPQILFSDRFPGLMAEAADQSNLETYSLVANIFQLFPDLMPTAAITKKIAVSAWAHEADHLFWNQVFGQAGLKFASFSLLELSAEASQLLHLLWLGASKEEVERLYYRDTRRTEYQDILENERFGHNYRGLMSNVGVVVKQMTPDQWSAVRRLSSG